MASIDPTIKIISGISLGTLFAILFVAGLLFPLRRRTRSLGMRLLVNGIFSLSSFTAGMLVVAPVSFYIMYSSGSLSFGVLNWLKLPYWIEFIIGFLFLDLTFYYWHRLNHEVGLLWRFHNVHHIDPDVDVTTSFRFHFVEILYSSLFRGLQVLIVGPSVLIYVIYEIVFQACTMFHHSNVRIPIKVERVINWVFVTPRMHGIHHSAIKGETNANYSVVFKWWDWIYRSLYLNVSQRDVTIGVPAYLKESDNHLWSCIAMPFVKQRDYWRFPDGREALARLVRNKGDCGILDE